MKDFVKNKIQKTEYVKDENVKKCDDYCSIIPTETEEPADAIQGLIFRVKAHMRRLAFRDRYLVKKALLEEFDIVCVYE
ncbi:MAG: hypothetical protein JJE36_06945 [Coriobacteriia bacterium]|nr:hypothetical protein [Coriobacteriia bacterium]